MEKRGLWFGGYLSVLALCVGLTACGSLKRQHQPVEAELVVENVEEENAAEAPSDKDQAGADEPGAETMSGTYPVSASGSPAVIAAEAAQMEDAEDPQISENRQHMAEEGPAVSFEQTLKPELQDSGSSDSASSDSGLSDSGSSGRKAACHGIDVAKWQGKIDWQRVKEAGVEFAMIRVGYRTQKTGVIYEDPYARYNLQEAWKADIKIGVYFFSTAVTQEEAREEAAWLCGVISQYPITYPVAYNCEGFADPENRQYGMTKEERTELAAAFLDYVRSQGYSPLFYAAKNELSDSREWETDRLAGQYAIWVSQYPEVPYPQTEASDYDGEHVMWQYTSQGQVEGIEKAVDINVAYFEIDQTAEPKDPTPAMVIEDSPELGIVFTELKETVTAKIATNLRTVPSTDSPETVVYQLQNGETVTRTGIGDNGWSRVEYQGQTLYAVTNYLTTRLEGQSAGSEGPGTQTEEIDFSGVIFTEVHETVTAKIETNLRTEPSTRSEDTVAAKLLNGEVAVRTGLGSNGWSRVEYEGQVYYAVTSYLTVVE